jgi:predicted DNA-binding protein
MKTLSIRLNDKDLLKLEELAQRTKSDKSTVARIALEEGIKKMQLDEALRNIRKRKWTIWKGAEYCNESYRSFLKRLKSENVPFPISLEELEREINDSY